MNLKKILMAAVLVLGVGAAFAQEVDEKTMGYTQKAVTQSFTIYQAHKDLNQLNAQDKAIDKALNETLPRIYNQVESGNEALGVELENEIKALTNTLLTYQQLYPANMLSQDYAQVLTINVSILYAAQNKLISEEVAELLTETLMESMMPEEE